MDTVKDIYTSLKDIKSMISYQIYKRDRKGGLK
jgi:hypothetical protein